MQLKYNDVVSLKNGSYTIIENLAAGGQGNVWKAEFNGAYYALKIPLASTGKKRAEMEIKLMSIIKAEDAIRHFIAPCCDTGEYDGKPVLVTPFYPDNLDNHMPVAGSRQELPTVSQCLRWLWQILSALAKTHSLLHGEQGKELVHRDIRAANLCLDADKNIRLIDFGIAKETDELSTFTTAHCEQAAAPEQRLSVGWKNGKLQYTLGVHVDIYALGLIGFRFFVAYYPQSQLDLNSKETLAQHLELFNKNKIGLLGKIGGLSAQEKKALQQGIKTRLKTEPMPVINDEAFSGQLAGLIESLLMPDHRKRPTVAVAKAQIERLICKLTGQEVQPPPKPQADTFIDVPAEADKQQRHIPFKPLAAALSGLVIVAMLVWQWPQLTMEWQLWQAERQLNQGTAAEQQAAWRTLNQLVNVSESMAAADILADFERETQRLLNAKQPAEQRAAVSRLQLSAEKGDTNAMLWLAYVKIKGQGTAANWPEAERWYQKAAALNNPEAKKRLQRLRMAMQNPLATAKQP